MGTRSPQAETRPVAQKAYLLIYFNPPEPTNLGPIMRTYKKEGFGIFFMETRVGGLGLRAKRVQG